MGLLTAPAITQNTEHFEAVYRDSHGDAQRVPWAAGRASPALINWLNAVAPSLIRCGSRVLVAGCGLGDDARELINRGYDVTAFDCSPSAVQCAKEADPTNADSYVVADIFAAPSKWRHRFDLVVEVNMLPMLKPDLREPVLRAMGELLAAHGRLLLIGLGTTISSQELDSPPWPITAMSLSDTAARAGLSTDGIAEFTDEDDIQRYRGVFVRA